MKLWDKEEKGLRLLGNIPLFGVFRHSIMPWQQEEAGTCQQQEDTYYMFFAWRAA